MEAALSRRELLTVGGVAAGAATRSSWTDHVP